MCSRERDEAERDTFGSVRHLDRKDLYRPGGCVQPLGFPANDPLPHEPTGLRAGPDEMVARPATAESPLTPEEVTRRAEANQRARDLTILARERGRSSEAYRIARLTSIGYELIQLLGDDPNRPGLERTPARWAAAMLEFAAYKDDNAETVFDTEGTDQMVVVSGIRVWSLCEHHLLPFYTDLTMAYLPVSELLGLSKFARIARLHAHKLQTQERLTQDIADHLRKVTDQEDVAVIGRGEHLCMSMRGVQSPHVMSTSAIFGRFRLPEVRQEFMQLAGLRVTG